MRKILTVVIFSCLAIMAQAQSKGYTPLKNTDAFRQALNQANASKESVVSDFTQTKHLSLLEDKITSKGQFFFKKENRIRIAYTEPYTYLLVMNGEEILVQDEQKTSRISTRNSKIMQSVNRIIIDCMSGNVLRNPDFSVAALESNNAYLLSLTPATDAMKKMFSRIDVYLDRKHFDVTRLTMTETGGDFTDMDFKNIRHNTPLNDALFKVK